jgi:hypothetical protein
MSYEDALLRATQKPPHSDSSWKAIRFSSGMRPRGGPGSIRLLKDHGDESLRRIETIRITQTKRSSPYLETAVKFLPRPRQRGLPLVDHWLRPKPAKTAHFFAGADRHSRWTDPFLVALLCNPFSVKLTWTDHPVSNPKVYRVNPDCVFSRP